MVKTFCIWFNKPFCIPRSKRYSVLSYRTFTFLLSILLFSLLILYFCAWCEIRLFFFSLSPFFSPSLPAFFSSSFLSFLPATFQYGNPVSPTPLFKSHVVMYLDSLFCSFSQFVNPCTSNCTVLTIRVVCYIFFYLPEHVPPSPFSSSLRVS